MDTVSSAVWCAIVVCSAVACAGNKEGLGSEQSTSSAVEAIPACSVPVSADTFSEASGAGCKAHTVFQICEVPSGSTIEGDGAITTPNDASVTCTDPCSTTEYSLACSGFAMADPGLNCKVVPEPTFNGDTNYCCPCGE